MRVFNITFVVFIVALTVSFVHAETFYVDDDGSADFISIQDAIQETQDGDIILVKDGIYQGEGNRDIDFNGKAITVRSENGPDNCIIDCQGSQAEPHRGFFFNSGEGKDSIVDGFTITNAHQDHAGGMYIRDNCSPTVMNCFFINNKATYGAGIGIRRNSNSLIYNCTFIGGYGRDAAAINNYEKGNPTIINCTFIGNSVYNRGGAIKSYTNSMTLINCLFSGNKAKIGGAIWIRGTKATITNCTFSNNSADTGQGIYTDYEKPVITNTILWGNGVGQSSQLYLDHGFVVINFSCIEGLDGTLGGVGNIGDNPMFVDADGADDIAGTIDDNLDLLLESPCVDTGGNDSVPIDSFDLDDDGNVTETIPYDIKQGDRFVNHLVDMGAHEKQGSVFLVNPHSIIVPEGRKSAFKVALGSDPLGPIEVVVENYSGDNDISVQSGAILSFDSSNYFRPKRVVLSAAEDLDHLNGTCVIQINAPNFLSYDLITTEADNEPHTDILFVDSGATEGLNNGSSWRNAKTQLSEALLIAEQHPQFKEVRVAQGIYTPDGTGNRMATFQLINDTHIKGGYAGFGAMNPNARDIDHYKTILSGDLEGNDSGGLDDVSRTENSCHVVVGSNTDSTAILDGFTIKGGNANMNLAPYRDGGGMYNDNGSPKVIHCTFIENQTAHTGGAIFNTNSSPIIAECSFISNKAGFGAGVENISCNPIFINSSFFDNHADRFGGGINGWQSDPVIIGCAFYANTAGENGGAVNDEQGYPEIINCTVVGNYSALGGGYYDRYGGGVLTNSIFWNNTNDSGSDESAQIDSERGYMTINYCCVEGWTDIYGGIGNLSDDPLFVNSEEHDYRLLPSSLCIDAGDNTAVPYDTADIDNDRDISERIPYDLEGNLRFVDFPPSGGSGISDPPKYNNIVDIGAFETAPLPIEVSVQFTPKVLNLYSKGNWVKAIFILPEIYDVNSVDTNIPVMIQPGYIRSESLEVYINENGLAEIVAAFDRTAFYEAVINETMNIRVTGSFIDGRQFYGMSSVKVVINHLNRISDLASHWLESCSPPDYCGGVDINKDSVVNLKDLLILNDYSIEFMEK